MTTGPGGDACVLEGGSSARLNEHRLLGAELLRDAIVGHADRSRALRLLLCNGLGHVEEDKRRREVRNGCAEKKLLVGRQHASTGRGAGRRGIGATRIGSRGSLGGGERVPWHQSCREEAGQAQTRTDLKSDCISATCPTVYAAAVLATLRACVRAV